jgi:hypothetical protein
MVREGEKAVVTAARLNSALLEWFVGDIYSIPNFGVGSAACGYATDRFLLARADSFFANCEKNE